MFWGLPASVRSFHVPAGCRYASSGATIRPSPETLKILFCGSDDFSIASLRALHEAKHSSPGLIESIDVVHRPPKPAGRGLKQLREVPIQKANGDDFKYNAHAINTFTGWTPPVDYNLVIAVSFGLLVPPRILDRAKYGGLNVHPSLLPDLRGPAPIHHTLLKKRKHTGISVQTLHPRHFDQGLILAQSPQPGVRVGDCSHSPLAELTKALGEEGGRMLVDVLKSRAFVPPLEDVGWYATSGGPIDHAEKVTKQHYFIDFTRHTVEDLAVVSKVFAKPWCVLRNGDRLILESWRPVTEVASRLDDCRGIWISQEAKVLAKMACGGFIEITSSTYAGGKTGMGNERLKVLYD